MTHPGHPDQPGAAPADVRGELATAATPVAVPRRRGSLAAIAAVGIAVAGVGLLLVAVYFLQAFGPTLTALGAVLALLPLGIVLAGVRWIDRWDPEPRAALVFAFLWGAGTSIVIALVVDVSVQVALAAGRVDAESGIVQLLTYTVQAPVVEEVGKGLGVLLLFLVARRHFDGPVDGVVYAAMTAAGFAFTENIQYFGLQIAAAGGLDGSVASIVFLRGILSPFAHVLFTAATGIALGWAALRFPSRWMWLVAFPAGLVPAILLHALWNGGAVLATDFIGFYVVVQVPIFVLAVLLVAWLRRLESRLTAARLGEYAAAGWLNADEVPVLATGAGRRTATRWADSVGLGQIMRGYIRDATRLAFARQRVVVGRDRIGAQADEAELLARITRARRTLLGIDAR
jgi:protease PrsW